MESDDQTPIDKVLSKVREELSELVERERAAEEKANQSKTGTKPKKKSSKTPDSKEGAKSPGSKSSNASVVSPKKKRSPRVHGGRSSSPKNLPSTLKVLGRSYRCTDETMQNMGLNLRETYDMYNSCCDKLNQVSLNKLGKHIRELHLEEDHSSMDRVSMLGSSYTFTRERGSTLSASSMATSTSRFSNKYQEIPELNQLFGSLRALECGKAQLMQNDAKRKLGKAGTFGLSPKRN